MSRRTSADAEREQAAEHRRRQDAGKRRVRFVEVDDDTGEVLDDEARPEVMRRADIITTNDTPMPAMAYVVVMVLGLVTGVAFRHAFEADVEPIMAVVAGVILMFGVGISGCLAVGAAADRQWGTALAVVLVHVLAFLTIAQFPLAFAVDQ